jgi:hypothetical protein
VHPDVICLRQLNNEDKPMKRLIVLAALLAILVLPPQTFCQSSFASLSGTINDSTGAIVPGVKVTATNAATGISSTTLSNNAGIYNLPGLLPGAYNVSAEKSGFQTQTFTDVALGNAAQVRLNFKLQVAGITQSVEVIAAADRLLLESGSSSGEVLVEDSVHALPLVNSNALDLVRVTSAYIPTGDYINNANQATIAGVSIANLSIQRDGVNVSDVRYPAGIHAPTQINPDLVSEFRMITAPVDAEVGRGNSQIQVLTKSGGNEYHGGAVWEVQNSALDSNQWSLNKLVPKVQNYRNINQYTLSLGGPIIKNKTFFFALWNQQIASGRDVSKPLALTPCARRGIFRYYDNWSNGLYNSALSLAGTTAQYYASVDAVGNPVAPPALQPSMLNADGSHKDNWQPHNGILRYASVFGIVENASSMAPDCSNAVVNTATGVSGGGWDTYRKAVDSGGFTGDSTGYISNLLSLMPPANNYDTAGGDGLNVAAHVWTRGFRGNDNLYGVGEYNQRKQFNLKINHNFNDRHRIDGSWSYEKGWSDNNLRVWPNGYGGYVDRTPQVLTVNFTSTLRSNLLNEVRFGMSKTGTNMFGPLDNPETGEELRAQLDVVNELPLVINPGTGGVAFQLSSSNFIGGRWAGLLTVSSTDVSPRWTYGDTLTWTKGSHSLKIGGELRLTRSKGTVNGTSVFNSIYPVANGGDPQGITVTGINSTNMPGLNGNQAGNQLRMQNLLSFLAASLSSVNQNYFINSPESLSAWNDPLTETAKIRDFQQTEFSFFLKDDWKVSNILTLNLGLRYEYYGIPYYKNGLTAALKGGPGAAYGLSGRSWSEAFWKPSKTPRADLTEVIFVGPDSPNPDLRPYARDINNFGPAVGFALQLPWLGAGRTIVRGGYQLSYLATGQATTVEGIIANPPGSTYPDTYTINNQYVDLAHVSSLIPVPQKVKPMQPFPVTDRTQTLNVYDGTFDAPYVHNLTMSLARNFRNNLTVEVKYIGTMSRRSNSTFNINTPNFLENGLLEAFNAARYGDDTNPATVLLDQIFAPVRGTTSGAKYLRTSTRTVGGVQLRRMLANGNYSGLASAINVWANPNAPSGTTDNGWLLRTAGFGENFVVANPQFATVNITGNRGYTNYHSMQAQVTMRPTGGLSVSGSYTLSKSLGITGSNPTDPRDFDADYTVTTNDRRHVFTSYGTYDLPFGPNRSFLTGTNGVTSRLLSGWQVSWVFSMTSGTPITWTSTTSMLYGTGVPDLVGDFPWSKVGFWWPDDAVRGNILQNSIKYVNDPQRNPGNLSGFGLVTSKDSLNGQCTLIAAADENDNIILQNPLPGTRGNFGFNKIYGLGVRTLDMAISKTSRITEGKSLTFRVDVTNIFNHPTPGGSATATTPGAITYYASNPALNLAGGTTYIGDLNAKAGQRSFQARIRFDF